MSVLENQRRLLLELVACLAPHWRRDGNLPGRLQRWLATHRAGSRDRRLYRELAYTTARILPWVEAATNDESRVGLIAAEAADTPATRDFRAAYARPELVAAADPAALWPAWCDHEIPCLHPAADQRTIMLTRPPLWLRVQTDEVARVAAELRARGIDWRVSPVLPDAWEVSADTHLTDTEAYREGLIEIQDIGSQLILALSNLEAGEHWLDACAGAGGKTLQLARLIGPTGRVDAHDIRPAALDELVRRAARAGLSTVTRLTSPPTATYDGVLVDAPCSGSGTWRRAPHLKWATTPAILVEFARRQSALLAQLAPRVRPGGRLLYATCSLCPRENEAVVSGFLDQHPEFFAVPPPSPALVSIAAPGALILPGAHDGDGFYFADLRRAGPGVG